jgi:hypothetical protein
VGSAPTVVRCSYPTVVLYSAATVVSCSYPTVVACSDPTVVACSDLTVVASSDPTVVWCFTAVDATTVVDWSLLDVIAIVVDIMSVDLYSVVRIVVTAAVELIGTDVVVVGMAVDVCIAVDGDAPAVEDAVVEDAVVDDCVVVNGVVVEITVGDRVLHRYSQSKDAVGRTQYNKLISNILGEVHFCRTHEFC